MMQTSSIKMCIKFEVDILKNDISRAPLNVKTATSYGISTNSDDFQFLHFYPILMGKATS